MYILMLCFCEDFLQPIFMRQHHLFFLVVPQISERCGHSVCLVEGSQMLPFCTLFLQIVGCVIELLEKDRDLDVRGLYPSHIVVGQSYY